MDVKPSLNQTWRVDEPRSAICVQSVDARMSCSSHSDTQLAAFFIDPRAKWSTVQYCFTTKFSWPKIGLSPQKTFRVTAPHEGGEHKLTRRRAKSFERLDLTQSSGPPAEQLAGRTKWSRALAPRTASGQRQTSQWPRDEESRDRSLCKARSFEETVNDPSAGSPTETLLRLLLPLNAQVWESFRVQGD